MSHRREQVASSLRKALVQVLQRNLSDPRIRGMVSITEVDVSPDLRQAKVLISVLPEKYERMTVEGLNAAKKHVNSHVKKYLTLRVVPLITFELDRSMKHQAEVFAAIREGLDRDQALHADGQATTAEDESVQSDGEAETSS